MMIVIDLKTETVKPFDSWGLCMFINELIKDNTNDLINKRYLFCPDEQSAKFLLEKMLEKAEKENKLLKEHYGLIH